MRGLPDHIFGAGNVPAPAPIRQPQNVLSRGLDGIAGVPSVGAGQVGTVLPAQGAGGPQRPSAVPPPAAQSPMDAPPAPLSGDIDFLAIDLAGKVIVTGTGELLPYPDDLQRHLIKMCLKIAIIRRNEMLQAIAARYGTSLDEIGHEMEEATARANQSMSGMPGEPSAGAVQANEEG